MAGVAAAAVAVALAVRAAGVTAARNRVNRDS